jgi:hypothetical protein
VGEAEHQARQPTGDLMDTKKTIGHHTSFIAYIEPEELHDATLLRFAQEDNRVTVYIQGQEGRSFVFEFLDVTGIHAISPEGMILYSLTEMKAEPPLRRFVFVNWDEEDKAALEIVAKDLRVIDTDK